MSLIRITVVSSAVALSLSACINEENVKLRYQGFEPAQGDDGWVVSSPASENMDNAMVESAFRLVYDEERFIMARSLLVLRNGRLVAEAYPHDDGDRWQIQNLQSCTKSFTSILAGIALSRGLLDSLEQPFSQIYPDEFTHHPDKTDITIEDALTMRTGIDFNDGDHTLDFYQTSGSSIDFVLSLPKDYPSGTVFHYNDGAPQFISAAIQQRAGKPLSSYADDYLFRPLQITDWKWEAAKDGRTFGAFSLYLKPRDAAKFGQLLLNNGRWNGQQLVDGSWIARSTQPLVTSSSNGASFGYYFWIYPAYQGYAAIGHGGQRIFVVPSKNLLIVYTAWPYTSSELFDEFSELADLIVRSCH
jgi:CubicO group peptidase (beta-lactamase class C family)